MSGKKIGYLMILIVIVLFIVFMLFNPFKSKETADLEKNEEEISLIGTIDQWDEIYDVAYSNDGKKIAIGSQSGVDIYAIEKNEIIVSKTGEGAPESKNLEFSPDDSLLVSGWDGVAVYNTEDLNEVKYLHGGKQSYVKFSPDGSIIATGNMDGILWLWETESGDKIKTFNPQVDAWVTALDFRFDGDIIAVGFGDGRVRIWNIGNDELIKDFEFESKAGVKAIAFSPNGKKLAAIEPDLGREVHIFDLESSSRIKILNDPQSSVRSLDFSADGKTLAYGEYDGTVALWNTTNWSLMHSFELSSVNSLDFSPKSNNLAVGTSDGTLYIYEMNKTP